MKKQVNVGLIGLGVVGSGTVAVLRDHSEEIAARLDFSLKLKTVFSRNIDKKETRWIGPETRLTSRVDDILEDPEIDIVVELIGGIEPAKQMILRALNNKKSVVTANKLLLAEHGFELIDVARANKVTLGMEASVAGGIPILRVIQEGLVGERITSIRGILNGTANYILSEMEKTGRPLAEILKEAQEQGYAESDPTLDIEGYDACNKLAILAIMSFGARVRYKDIPVRGISSIIPIDFTYAHRLGCTIKLLAIAERRSTGNLALSVQPVLIPTSNILAKVEGAFNAILVRGAKSGDSMYYGKGAGGAPTGIAVVSDIISVARNLVLGRASRTFPFNYEFLHLSQLADKREFTYPYYVRFVVKDQLGIIARLAETLAKYGINIDAVLQEPIKDKKNLPFVITLEAISEDRVEQATKEMSTLEFLKEEPLVLRIDNMESGETS